MKIPDVIFGPDSIFSFYPAYILFLNLFKFLIIYKLCDSQTQESTTEGIKKSVCK